MLIKKTILPAHNTKNFIFFQKTNTNFFISLCKEKRLIFKISLYAFVGKQENMAPVRNFWYVFTKFLHRKLVRLQISTFNVVRLGLAWYYRLTLFLIKGQLIQKIKGFYILRNFVHNGCRLKKKRRRKRKKRFKKFRSSRL